MYNCDNTMNIIVITTKVIILACTGNQREAGGRVECCLTPMVNNNFTQTPSSDIRIFLLNANSSKNCCSFDCFIPLYFLKSPLTNDHKPSTVFVCIPVIGSTNPAA